MGASRSGTVTDMLTSDVLREMSEHLVQLENRVQEIEVVFQIIHNALDASEILNG